MFGFLLMVAMHGLLDFGTDKNAFVATGTFGLSIPLFGLKIIGSFDGAWSSGPRGTETCDFGGRLETACSGIKFCLCAEGKGFDGGVTSICIRGVGLGTNLLGGTTSIGEGFHPPHDNSNNYVYHIFCLSAMHDTTLGVHIGMIHLYYSPFRRSMVIDGKTKK